MIFSSIDAGDNVQKYPGAIQTALKYLKETDFVKMEPGVYEIQGREIFAQVMDIQTEPIEKRRPEVHEQYIDVQFLVSGRERLGFAVNRGTCQIAERIEERDLIFYQAVEHEGFIEATPGCYSIFFPEDIHRPGIVSGTPMCVRKVVVKVHTSLI